MELGEVEESCFGLKKFKASYRKNDVMVHRIRQDTF